MRNAFKRGIPVFLCLRKRAVFSGSVKSRINPAEISETSELVCIGSPCVILCGVTPV